MNVDHGIKETNEWKDASGKQSECGCAMSINGNTNRDADVSDAAIADAEAFDILAHLDNRPNGFVARNQLNAGGQNICAFFIARGHTGNLEINSPCDKR